MNGLSGAKAHTRMEIVLEDIEIFHRYAYNVAIMVIRSMVINS